MCQLELFQFFRLVNGAVPNVDPPPDGRRDSIRRQRRADASRLSTDATGRLQLFQ